MRQANSVFLHRGADYWLLRLPAAHSTRDLQLPKTPEGAILSSKHRESEECRFNFVIGTFADATASRSSAISPLIRAKAVQVAKVAKMASFATLRRPLANTEWPK